MRTKERRAFTLVEILIVICVISILFVVLISRVDFATDKARTTGAQNDIHALQMSAHTVGLEDGKFVNDINLLASRLNENLDSELIIYVENNVMKTTNKDPWGTEYLLEYDEPVNTKGRITIISAGPDITYKTQDDIKSEVVFKIENGKGNVIIDGVTDNNEQNGNDEHVCVFNNMIKNDRFIATPGTCITHALYYYSCSCGAMSSTTFKGELSGHQYDSGIETTPATCTAQGVITCTCSVCFDKQHSFIPMKNHEEVIDNAVAATCTQNGLTEGKHCSVCNATLISQQVIPAKGHTLGNGADCTNAQTCTVCNEELDAALGHDYQPYITPPTCLTDGYTTHTCTRCGDNYKDNEVPAQGHVEIIDNAITTTCTKNGLTEGKHCSVCNEILIAQTTITATGHTEVIDKAVAATCTKTGLTAGSHCSVCSEIIKAQETINANGHTEVVDKAIEATCTTDGKTQGKHCSVCNTVIIAQTAVAAKGHTLGNGANCTKAQTCTVCKTELAAALGHDYKSNITEPTCTENGYTLYVCSRCGDSYQSNVVTAKGHTEVIDNAVAATCTTTGKTQGKHCSVCNTVLVAQTTVAAKGHTEVIDNAVAATCTTSGKTQGKHCSVCNAVIVAQTTVAAKGHTEVVDNAVAATCTVTGKTQGKHCSVCNYVFTAQQSIAALGHDYQTTTTNPTCTVDGRVVQTCSRCDYYNVVSTTKATGHVNQYPVPSGTANKHMVCSVCSTTTSTKHIYNSTIELQATCTTKGKTKYTCDCGYSYIDQDIPMIDHVYGDDDFCDNCGSEKELTAGLYKTGSDYTVLLKSWNQLISEGSVKVSGTTVSSVTASKLSGDLVIPNGITSIGTVFKSNTYLTGIKIPNSITSLSNNVFNGCSKLTHIYLPQSISSIGSSAFSGCKALVNIEIPEKVTVIESSTFYNCQKLTSIKLSGAITSIGSSAFSSCSELINIVIPETVTAIGNSAFYYCKSLERIELPPNLTKINETVFSNCSALKDVTIPGSVSIIDKRAFGYCSSLESITIPEGVEEIELRGFEGCSSLRSIYIPTTLKQIGTFSFIDCPNICSVYIEDMVSWVKLSFMTFNYDCHTNPLSYGADLYLNGEIVTTLNLPEEVTILYGDSFDGCRSITRVNIPATVTSMNENFLGCMNIIEYNVDPKNKYYTSIDGILYGTRGGMNSLDLVHYPIAKTETVFVIPETVTEICDHAFAYSPYLEKVVFHENLYDIAYSAFHGCDSGIWTEYDNAYYVGNDENPYMTLYWVTSSDVTSCNIHPDTININSEAFEYCKSIESLTIPANIQKIGGLAFYNCANLKTLIFEDNSNLKKIVAETFLLCTIENVYITNLEAWCNVSMSYYTANPMYRGANLYVNNELLTSFNLQNITKIGDYTLYGCISLTDVIIPETVNYIGLYAFTNCSNLQSIEVKRLSGWVLYGNGGNPASNQYTNERDLSDVSINVIHFTSTYAQYSWRIEE